MTESLPAPVYSLCMGAAGVCGGEGIEKTAGGGVTVLPSPSDTGPEPRRTEPSRSANFTAAEEGGGGDMGDRALEGTETRWRPNETKGETCQTALTSPCPVWTQSKIHARESNDEDVTVTSIELFHIYASEGNTSN